MIKRLFLLLFCSALFAGDPMAQFMTQEEQDRTGVSKLYTAHKEELAQWMDSHGKNGTVDSLTLRLNIKDGEYLQLSDGSVWQIAPCCQKIASSWLTAEKVQISRSDSPKFPYYIINQKTGERVMAHHLSRLPNN